MALWTTRTSDRLVVRRLPVVPWAIGLSLAAAVLVPVVFERGEKPASRNHATISTGLKRAALILVVTAGLCPSTSLAIDLRRRSAQRRRRRFLGVWSTRSSCEGIVRAQRRRQPDLRLLARHAVLLEGATETLTAPLGWAWGAEGRREMDRIADEIERSLASPESRGPPACIAATSRPRFQLSLRRLLFAVFVAAAALGLVRTLSQIFDARSLPGLAATASMIAAGCMLFRWGEPAIERMLLLLVVTYAPFAWIVEVARPWGNTSGMWKIFLFFPSSFVACLFFRSRVPHEYETWIAAALTLLEFAALCACAVRGWKWTLAAASVVGLVSCLLSLGAYAAYRM